MIHLKEVHILINSAIQLPEYDFFIAGKGILEKKLKELAKNHNNINFLGSTEDPEFISKMDIMVVPSIREPLGNTIIEAGYCKKAVIASNVDGIAEIIKSESNGILIDPEKELSFYDLNESVIPIPDVVFNPTTQDLQKPREVDPLKLKNAIRLLASNVRMREKYGENLYKTVKEKFNIEIYFETLEKFYKSFYRLNDKRRKY